MPVPSQNVQSIHPNALRVLITGYGPFRDFKVNPSWLAVKPLHNTVLFTNRETSQPIHVTSLEVPTSYETVLSITPTLHADPTVVPLEDPTFATPSLPAEGYDLIIHVGVASCSERIRMEQRGRKYGYNLEDANGKMCPVAIENEGVAPIRGFGKNYEQFPEELFTQVDCEKLVEHLKETGISEVTTSMDAGLYLCEFINYCSLAEARRIASSHRKRTKVLFIHVPPVNEPLSTEEVTEALRRTISWICGQ